MFQTGVGLAVLVVSLPIQLCAQQVESNNPVIVLNSSNGVLSGGLGEMVLTLNARPRWGYGDVLSMLSNPRVQKELELVADQQRQLQELQSNVAKRINELRSGRAPDLPKDDGQAREAAIQKERDEQKRKMREILLPHQLDRLNQVSLQMRMKGQGDMESLTGQELAEALGISDEQKERIRRRAAELKTEMEQEIEKLKKKARKELLRELTPEQRARLEKMLGSEFDDKPLNPQKAVKQSGKS